MTERAQLLLVCSPGGHLLQMQGLLAPVFSHTPHRLWISLKAADSESLLKDEPHLWAYGPTNRSLLNLVRNSFLALKILYREKPRCIVSTGAGLAVPFLILGRLFGAKTIYLESFARQTSLSLSGRMVYPFVSAFLVQSPELARRYPRARFEGSAY